jgi:lysophosphatidylglycerol acyltransferase 1
LLKWFGPLNRKWIYLFPEGGFLWKRKETSQAYAKKNGYPVLEHVTLPRIGAMQAILETLSPEGIKLYGDQMPKDLKPTRPLKWLIDITIGYPKGHAMDLMTIICGWRPPCDTTMHYRKYPIEELPLDSDALTAWLYERFIEKEELLKEFHETGKFPPSARVNCNHVASVEPASRHIHMDNAQIAMLHVFFLTLTYVEYRVIAQLLTVLWGIVSFFI